MLNGKSRIIGPIVVCLFLAFVIQFSHSKLKDFTRASSGDSDALVPSPVAAKLISLGFDQLMADYYWLAFVSYLGDTEARLEDRYALADRYLELITSLDPNFVQAYWFAAFSVGGDQGRPQRAQEIIQRGLENNKDNWTVPYIAGVNQFLFAKNNQEAARFYALAATYPDAPEWLERQSKIFQANIPDLVKEGLTWLNIYNTSGDERVQERARQHCIAIWSRIFVLTPNKESKKNSVRILSELGADLSQLPKVKQYLEENKKSATPDSES